MVEHRHDRRGNARGPRVAGAEAPPPDPTTGPAATAAAVDFLNTTFDHLGRALSAAPSEVRADALIIRVMGEDLAGLKRRPELVGSLAQLAGQAVARACGERWQCTLDLDGNLAAREALLEVVARDVAGAVAVNGRRAVLADLSPQERRVVHKTLQIDGRVRTWSEGEANARVLHVQRA